MKHIKVFTASWCAPCKVMSQFLDELSKQGVKVEKIDVDDNIDLAAKSHIRSVPTIRLMNGDVVCKTYIGFMTLKQLQNFIGHL